MEIMMTGADVAIAKDPLGNTAIVAIDGQSGIRVLIPLTQDGVRAVATALTSNIAIVKDFPKN